MSLLDKFSEEFILMDRRRVPDGETGFDTKWVETDVVIRMPQAHNTTVEAQMAEREGTASTYSFYPPQGIEFEYHDVLKRKRDGQIFRITSQTGDKYTPDNSRLKIGYVNAEKWELPQ